MVEIEQGSSNTR